MIYFSFNVERFGRSKCFKYVLYKLKLCIYAYRATKLLAVISNQFYAMKKKSADFSLASYKPFFFFLVLHIK